MEQNRFFIVVSRINYLLILLATISAIVAAISITIISNSFGNRNSVEVIKDEGKKESIELRLGNLEEMTGHQVQTVNLTSDAPNRGFSSGYGGSEIRNVLFLVGERLNTKWLYANNSYLITCFCKLRKPNEHVRDDTVLALYVAVIKEDSNNDEMLSDKDAITLALIKPDGSKYTEVSTDLRKILDSTVTDGGDNVTFMVQVGNNIVIRKYSLATFSLVSERQISEIAKKL